ncbi:MAG TPA: hypothetical protein H9953_01815 [Candidatus Fusicatenibacter intestinipullorum]|nr:hypothetical protein [Candidatus Fusicatenibacter intestinipullorum]
MAVTFLLSINASSQKVLQFATKINFKLNSEQPERFFSFTFNKKPINTTEDAAGMKRRPKSQRLNHRCSHHAQTRNAVVFADANRSDVFGKLNNSGVFRRVI